MTDLENKQKKMLDQASQELRNKQMANASAAGNKPVESAKNPGNIQPQKSVNEIEFENMMRQRSMANKGITTPSKPIASRQEDEQIRHDNKMRSMGYMVTDRSKPDDKQLERTVKKSTSFHDIVNEGIRKEREAKEKAQKASKYAKAAAWGEMFSALGQIAGLGKNVYMKPDNQYLNKALTKADEARAVYDKAKEYAASAPKDYLRQATNALKEDFYKRQKDYNDYVVKHNKEVTTRLNNEAKNKETKRHNMVEEFRKAKQLELDQMYKKGLLSVQQYQAQTARLNADTNRMRYNLEEVKSNRSYEDNQNKMFTYTDTKDGYTYRFPSGMNSQLADAVLKYGNYDASDFGLTTGQYNTPKYGKLTAEDLKDEKVLRSAITKFIADNKDKKGEVGEVVMQLLEAGQSEVNNNESSYKPYTPPKNVTDIGVNPNLAGNIAKEISDKWKGVESDL